MLNGLPLPASRASRRQSHYFYGHYYAVQAMWQAGSDYWDRWYPAIRDELLRSQRRPPSFTDRQCFLRRAHEDKHPRQSGSAQCSCKP